MLSRETMEKLEGLKKTIEDIVWSFDIKKESLCRSLSGDALDVDMLITQELQQELRFLQSLLLRNYQHLTSQLLHRMENQKLNDEDPAP